MASLGNELQRGRGPRPSPTGMGVTAVIVTLRLEVSPDYDRPVPLDDPAFVSPVAQRIETAARNALGYPFFLRGVSWRMLPAEAKGRAP